MKHTLITALLLASSAAHAGNPVSLGLDDPHVLVPPASASGWSGPYVGYFIAGTRAINDIDDIYVRECRFGDGHTARKCSVEGHEDSQQIAELDRVETPWRAPEFPSSRPMSEPVVYQSGPTLLYGAPNTTFTYETTTPGDPVAVHGKNAENVLVDTITELVNGDATLGGFAGYRFDVGPAVMGVEVATDRRLTTLEASAGIPMGDVLAYAFAGAGQFNNADGDVYGIGADYHVGNDWSVGLKGTMGEFGNVTTETVALRVSRQF